MKDIRQTLPYSKYLESENWQSQKINGNYYHVKNLHFYKLIKLQRPEKVNINDIKKISKRYKGIVQLVIEPTDDKQTKQIKKLGFKQTGPYVPSKTIFLDLKPSEKKIYDNFTKDARYCLRKSENIKLAKWTDMQRFHNVWKNSVPTGRYVLSTKQLEALKKTFGKRALFLLDKEFDAGAIFLVVGQKGYYWYGFVDKKTRKSLAMYKVLFEGIKWCKKSGAKQMDFEGIYDERFPIKAWEGFTKFKQKFGGTETEFPGAFKKTFINWF